MSIDEKIKKLESEWLAFVEKHDGWPTYSQTLPYHKLFDELEALKRERLINAN